MSKRKTKYERLISHYNKQAERNTVPHRTLISITEEEKDGEVYITEAWERSRWPYPAKDLKTNIKYQEK